MPDLLVRSFAPLLLAFQSCFTQPSFQSFWAVTCAWILCSGRRSLTRIIQSGQLTEFKHYCSFHRFFSQARWRLTFWQLRLPESSGTIYPFLGFRELYLDLSGGDIWAANNSACRAVYVGTSSARGHSAAVGLDVTGRPLRGLHTGFLVHAQHYRKRQTNQRAPGKGENWSANKPARPPPSNIAPVPNWPWR